MDALSAGEDRNKEGGEEKENWKKKLEVEIEEGKATPNPTNPKKREAFLSVWSTLLTASFTSYKWKHLNKEDLNICMHHHSIRMLNPYILPLVKK